MSFYTKKINIYKSAQSSSNTVQENAALAFEAIAKKIEEFECLYAKNEFEKASNKVAETLTLCEGISGLLIDISLDTSQLKNEATQTDPTLDWQIYFIELMRTISSLTRDHNAVKKEKLIKSLRAVAMKWREVPNIYSGTVSAGQRNIEMDA